MATASDYNGDLVASRKLTDEEAAELRDILLKSVTYTPDLQEDVNDLLDYTFAMTSNGKSLSYIVGELLSMEMEVCPEPQAHLIAKQIESFLKKHVNSEQEPPHVVSLKVCLCERCVSILALYATIGCDSYSHFFTFHHRHVICYTVFWRTK